MAKIFDLRRLCFCLASSYRLTGRPQELPGHGVPGADVDQGARLHRGPSQAQGGDDAAAGGVHGPRHRQGEVHTVPGTLFWSLKSRLLVSFVLIGRRKGGDAKRFQNKRRFLFIVVGIGEAFVCVSPPACVARGIYI